LKQYEYCAKKRISDYPVEHLSRLIEEVDVAEEGSLQIFVEGEITRQLIHMFRCIRHDYQSQKNSSIAKSAKFEMPFTLEVKPSKLHEAGDGVFVKVLSSALAPPTGAPASERPYLRPGTVVALYPGLVHLKEHLNENSYLRTLLPDPDYMLQTRLDQMIIDARKLSAIPTPSPNPFAVAHKINHCVDQHQPVPNTHTNVMQITYNYPDSDEPSETFPAELRPWIPNRYAKLPSEKSAQDLGFGACCMHGLVMVTTEKVYDGDELLMDYRLNPEAGKAGLWPTWYRPFDARHTEQRWTEAKQYL
jgi:hypothetical protein